MQNTERNMHSVAGIKGDGKYPVYFEYNAKGEVCAVIVRFIDIEDRYKKQK